MPDELILPIPLIPPKIFEACLSNLADRIEAR